MDVDSRDDDELCVGAVRVLAEHDDPVAVGKRRVDDHPVADRNTVDPLAQPADDTRAVGAQDARLRDGREPAPDPDVEAVHRGGTELEEHLARPGCRVRGLLEDENLGAAVLVDSHGLHRWRA